ncbi:MAG TPA: VOC family protein [Candidatus Acidoferrales bacterium]|nr:VOC family protein [Candidatus Acidoferrales bacterium]
MSPIPNARLIGVELYFDDLTASRRFYSETLGLTCLDEDASRYARFAAGPTFVCLECKGVESYPSRDKVVLFFEVPDLTAAVNAVGRERILQMAPRSDAGRPAWAVLHDPEGHNIILLEAPTEIISRT